MEPARVRAQLDRILTSAAFSDAARASGFLRFIVERALDGRLNEIKESVIAIEVLGRNSSFDSKTDPIVRVEAARLRDRLRAYYDDHGGGDDVLVTVPKGTYVPVFADRQSHAEMRRADLLRLSLLPPANAPFDSFAISPDGRRLAFTAHCEGNMMLWVRDLDSLSAKLLPGTEAAAFPFWSPDSRSIGFFTPSKLKIVPAAGGPSRDVAEVVLGRGGTWNRAGVVVFCPRPVGPLYQVPAAGGTPRPVTSLDVSRAEVSHGFPQFFPDGRRFLYLAASQRPKESSIQVGSLDSSITKQIVSADASAFYAPAFGALSGGLLFVAHGSLLIQRLDEKSLELRGEPQTIAPKVQFRRWGQTSASVSNDGFLLYQEGTIENHQFAWVDRQGMPLSQPGPQNSFGSSPHYSFNLSPDERRVAIHRHDDPDRPLATIWIMDLFRNGALWRFTDPGCGEAEFCPVWSSDSTELVFSSGDDRGMRLLRRALNGGIPASVVDSKGPKFPSDWSDDCRFIAYNSQEPDYKYLHTWVAPALSKQEPYALLGHSHCECSARFAPQVTGQGPRWVAYASDETGRYEIYICSFPDGGQKWQISSEGGFLPQWRRDGRELFFIATGGSLMAVTVNPDSSEFSAPQKLFDTGLHLHSHNMWMNKYGVGRDGQRFLLNRPTDRSSLVITAVLSR